MNFDDLLVNHIGEFGRYQLTQFILLMLPCVYISMQSVSWTFTGAKIDYRCQVSEWDSDYFWLPENFSVSALPDSEARRYTNLTKKEQDQLKCGIPNGFGHSEEATTGHHNDNSITRGNDDKLMTKRAVSYGGSVSRSDDSKTCDKWLYDTSEVSYSAMQRWDIVCGRYHWRATIQSVYYVGQAVGSLLFGYIGDRWGRKLAFVSASWILCFSGIILALTPWIELFTLLRFLAGLAHPGVFVVAIIMGMELVGPSKRAAGSVAANLAFSIGQIGLVFFAYFISDYQHLQLALSLPCILFLTYYWFVPRSVRWLLSKQRYQEADVILRRVAKINGRSLPEGWYHELDEPGLNGTSNGHTTLTDEEDSDAKLKPAPGKPGGFGGGKAKSGNFLDLFRTPHLRMCSLVQFFSWPTVSMVYYGISMDPSFLGGDRYMTFFLSAIIEVPGVFIAGALINSAGRKATMMASFGISGLFMMLTLLPSKDQTTLLIIFVVIAKMAITAAYTVIYAWSPELFPTIIRNQAMGVCSMVARVGGVAASYLVMMVADKSKASVSLTFGACALLAMALSQLLPETSGARTLETIEETEVYGAQARVWSFRAPESFCATNDPGKYPKPKDDSSIGGASPNGSLLKPYPNTLVPDEDEDVFASVQGSPQHNNFA